MLRASSSADAARAQVEHRVLVELADRRAVRALHVVGEDLELRLRVDLRVVGQQQRLVRLLRVGLLRVLADDDLAVEDRARTCPPGCPCRPRGSGNAASRDRSSCACRRACRRRRRTGRSACTRRLRRRAPPMMSLRAIRPPNVSACDVNVLARCRRTATCARWNAVVGLALQLDVIDDGVRAELELGHGVRERARRRRRPRSSR